MAQSTLNNTFTKKSFTYLKTAKTVEPKNNIAWVVVMISRGDGFDDGGELLTSLSLSASPSIVVKRPISHFSFVEIANRNFLVVRVLAIRFFNVSHELRVCKHHLYESRLKSTFSRVISPHFNKTDIPVKYLRTSLFQIR